MQMVLIILEADWTFSYYSSKVCLFYSSNSRLGNWPWNPHWPWKLGLAARPPILDECCWL